MDDLEVEGIDPALAASMGFSSFGAQPTAKKRKFNHATDAVVDRQQAKQSEVPAKSKNASGSNKTTLGVRERRPPAEISNIVGNGSQSMSTPDKGNKNGALNSTRSEQSSAEIASPAVARAEHNDQQESRPGISGSLEQVPSVTATANEPNPAISAMPASDAKDAHQSAHSPAATGSGRASGHGGLSQAELQALRKGVKDERGDVAYFLPSFVEDPWKGL